MLNESQGFSKELDEEWYAREYPDVEISGLSPAEHYKKYGALLGRPPRPSTSVVADDSENVSPGALPKLFEDLRLITTHSLAKAREEVAIPTEGSAPTQELLRRQVPERVSTAASTELNAADAHSSKENKSAANIKLQPKADKKKAKADQSVQRESSAAGIATKPGSQGAVVVKQHYSLAEQISIAESSGLVNKKWYASEYKDIARRGAEPVSHFIRHGAREGRDPGPGFSTKWYVDEYGAEIPEGINPLIHYCLWGKSKGYLPKPKSRNSKVWWMAVLSSSGNGQDLFDEENILATRSVFDASNRLAKKDCLPAIIIPVYNAPEEVEECLRSVFLHTEKSCRIIVIDDASPDPKIKKILGKYKGKRNLEIHVNKKNLGFTRTVNRGISLAGRSDVVFLNSDTKVTPGWLRRLRIAAYSSRDIGTVTPFSNNAGAFSAPIAGPEESPVPEWLSLDEYARAIAHASRREYPEVPTGNGFCLYIRRDCLDEVGELDAVSFPRGYGEENDFCMRAGRLGWRHIIDDSSYVYHVRSASFGESKRDLMAAGRRVIDERYPNYSALIRESFNSQSIKRARDQVRIASDALGESGDEAKPRILYVLSTYTGGTPQTNQDLMQSINDRLETFVLRCNSKRMSLMYYLEGEYIEMETHILSSEIKAFPHRSEEYDVVIANWLVKYAIELVHVRHIAWHGFGLIEQAKNIGLPVVFSFHDFYTVCPTVNLLDETNTFCSGKCSSGKGECVHALWTEPDFPPLKNNAIHQWRIMFGNLLKRCDAFVTTAPSARDLMISTYPFLKDRIFEVIPHGRNFVDFYDIAADFNASEKLRILVPGNISNWKGADVVRYLSKHAESHNFEMHIMGSASDDLMSAPGIVYHGKYDREEFGEIVKRIDPHIGAVFSISLETYCHTLTEMWSLGIPVLAYDLGAAGDRIEETQAGWLAGDVSPEAALALILRLKDNPQDIEEKRSNVLAWQKSEGTLHNCEYMAHRYFDVYRSLLFGGMPRPSDSRPKVGIIVPNSLLKNYQLQKAPASTHIRLGEKTRDGFDRSIRYEYVNGDAHIDHLISRYDAILIQRTALTGSRVIPVVDALTAAEKPLIFELDDDLLERAERDGQTGGEYGEYLNSVRTLLTRSSLVTVSTAELKTRYQALNDNIAIIENAVSERLWLSPVPSHVSDLIGRKNPGETWAVYMGSSTHSEDLALLKNAVRQANRKCPGLRLFTIGITGEKGDWYESIPIPEDKRNYPDFVRWLRGILNAMDFGVAPLVESSFNAAKSDLKFLEYSAAKLPVMCSRVKPYVDVVIHGKNGMLVENNDEAWEYALLFACQNANKMLEMAREGFEYAKNERSVRRQLSDFDAAIYALIRGKSTVRHGSLARKVN
ncbi:glycosyltransferase [Burkholderia pseudomultivorans]|uniref:glycosyltransferase n=1 Tax=Burkholderia pseudomultivorans TaxID=1207504 RepID=UPI000ACB28C0|nr:glycosyltransferase [Burkholderia pseudomultivorans]